MHKIHIYDSLYSRFHCPSLLFQALLDHESPLATIALSKSDKELKESDRMGGDTNDEVCPFKEVNDYTIFQSSCMTFQRIDVEELDGPFTFRRKVHLHYHKVTE